MPPTRRDGAGHPLQQRGAGNRYGFAAEERRAGRDRAGRLVSSAAALLTRLEPIENIGCVGKCGAPLQDADGRTPDRHQQRDDEHDIGQRRHEGVARERAVECGIGDHDGGENTGLMRASM